MGGGPSALLLAAHLDQNQFDVAIYEKNAALGRKFLVAGQGGFNLTHSEAPELMVSRYTPSSFINKALKQFSNHDLIKWLAELGIETYVGTSKRVFPVKGTKPVDVLNAILIRLRSKGVKIHTHYDWKGFGENNRLLFTTPKGQQSVVADTIIFALGGGSWKVTGSDGSWLNYFEKKNIVCEPFRSSNCAFKIEWRSDLQKLAGTALKNCTFTCGNTKIKGEAVLTKFGIEGSGVYPLSGEIRKQLDRDKEAILFIDLKPPLSIAEIKQRLEENKGKALTKFLHLQLKLNKNAVQLLKLHLLKEEFMDTVKLSTAIKQFPLKINGLAPLDEAISTVGGILLDEISANYELKKLPDHFVIGEMLNWDAPTGGYLLQGCFSMAYDLAKYLNTKAI